MKKHNIALIVATLLFSLTACGGEANDTEEISGNIVENIDDSISYDDSWLTADPYDYMANDLSEFIKVGKYTGLEVTKESAVVTDEEFEEEIATLLDSYSYYEEYTDRAVDEGDTVICDFAGYRDGVAFEGGTGTNQTLTAASGTGYIPGFAEAFIGQLPGEEFSFDVTFPESYDNAELAGVEVTFVCTVHAVRGNELILPELTDEFVHENFGYGNVEEFMIAYRDVVEKNKESSIQSTLYTDLWLQVVQNSEITAYPETEVNRIYAQQRSMYEQYASQFGVDYTTFLSSYLNMTDETLFEECRAYVKEDIIMYQLIKELNIELTDAEYEEGVELFAASYGMTAEELKAYYGEDAIYTTIIWQKLMESIADEAIIIEG